MKTYSKKFIKLFEPHIGKKELTETSKILKSKFWASGSGIGKVSEFENKFSKFVGGKHTIAVNSGTAALHLAISTLNVQSKEILLPSMTFVSTATAAYYNNAIPKFVDINEETLTIDLDDLRKKISKKTKVIIPVHFGGFPCNLKELDKIKKEYDLHIVEDAAHACGSEFNGKKIGSHNELVCFSFHPVKNLAMPAGGAIVINNKNNSLNLLKAKRWCGITKRNNSLYEIEDVGWNFYMNELSAGIGIIQLAKLNMLNKRRKQIAKMYSKNLSIEKKMKFSEDCNYHLFWIRVKNRDEVMKKMQQKGIETGIHYKPIHMMKLFSNKNHHLKTTESIWKELVSIPIHPNLSNENVEKIIKNINIFAK